MFPTDIEKIIISMLPARGLHYEVNNLFRSETMTKQILWATKIQRWYRHHRLVVLDPHPLCLWPKSRHCLCVEKLPSTHFMMNCQDPVHMSVRIGHGPPSPTARGTQCPFTSHETKWARFVFPDGLEEREYYYNPETNRPQWIRPLELAYAPDLTHWGLVRYFITSLTTDQLEILYCGLLNMECSQQKRAESVGRLTLWLGGSMKDAIKAAEETERWDHENDWPQEAITSWTLTGNVASHFSALVTAELDRNDLSILSEDLQLMDFLRNRHRVTWAAYNTMKYGKDRHDTPARACSVMLGAVISCVLCHEKGFCELINHDKTHNTDLNWTMPRDEQCPEVSDALHLDRIFCPQWMHTLVLETIVDGEM